MNPLFRQRHTTITPLQEGRPSATTTPPKRQRLARSTVVKGREFTKAQLWWWGVVYGAAIDGKGQFTKERAKSRHGLTTPPAEGEFAKCKAFGGGGAP